MPHGLGDVTVCIEVEGETEISGKCELSLSQANPNWVVRSSQHITTAICHLSKVVVSTKHSLHPVDGQVG